MRHSAPIVAVLLGACVSSSPPPRSGPAGGPPPYGGPTPSPYGRPGPQGQGAPGCGMTVFLEPACEAAMDQGCCVQQQNCFNDPACRRISDCISYCESRRATEGCNCFANCAPQGRATPGLPLYEYVTSCSKGIDYPQGVQCRSGC